MSRPRYAVYTLPTVGDRLLWAAKHRGLEPAYLFTRRPEYWAPLELPMLDPDDPDRRHRLENAGVEFILVAGWSTRIGPEDIDWLPKGGWNIHPSLLPDYRGFNPYFWVIARGETQTGLTVHRLSQRFDEGPMLFSHPVPIHPLDTSASLFERIVTAQAEVGLKAAQRIHRGDIATRPQPEGVFPRAPKVRAEHLHLHPGLSMAQADRLVRAANPDHGARLQAGAVEVRVLEVQAQGRGPRIRCADGELIATIIDHPHLGIVSGEKLLQLHRPTSSPGSADR